MRELIWIRRGAALAAALCAATLAACGSEDAPPEAAAAPVEPVTAQADPAMADLLFADMCAGLGAGPQVCGCVRGRLLDQAGPDALGYIGAAYGDRPDLAAPYEARMSQADRNEAAEVFLGAQFDCVIASDPDYTDAPVPDLSAVAAGDEESPFEQAVAACVAAGAAPEAACRCRVDSVFDVMGGQGVAVARAVEAGDEDALRALAADLGIDGMTQARTAMAEARDSCGA